MMFINSCMNLLKIKQGRLYANIRMNNLDYSKTIKPVNKCVD